MSDNAILGYLDLVWRVRNTTKRSFLDQKKSFNLPKTSIASSSSAEAMFQTPPRGIQPNRSSSSTGFNMTPIDLNNASPDQTKNDLPIHDILLEIQTAVLGADAEFFEPFILHHWQLQRLLDMIRCNTKLLSLPTIQRANSAKIHSLRLEVSKEGLSPEKIQNLEKQLQEIEGKNQAIIAEIAAEKAALEAGNRPQDQESIQAALVLSTLLNVVFRDGMSVPLLSDQLRLEAQQFECRELLSQYCNINFDDRFIDIFARHPSVQTSGTVPERIKQEFKYLFAWLFDDGSFFGIGVADRMLAAMKHFVARVLGIQAFHGFYNHLRLGITRFRRLLAFLEPFLKNSMYTAVFKTVDPYMRAVLAYVNWMFFIPRLSLNLYLLFHHLNNVDNLEPLEKNVDPGIRFRAHWTRFWFEVFTDIYWILIGLKVCFALPGGALSPVGIFMSLTVQLLDLVHSILRAAIELYRLYKMALDLDGLGANLSFKESVNKRIRFEMLALGYMIFHFSVLMLCLCLTLPSMSAVSLMLPVIGGIGAVLITCMTYYMQNYFNQRRQNEFEPKPPAMPENDSDVMRMPSMRRMNSTTYA